MGARTGYSVGRKGLLLKCKAERQKMGNKKTIDARQASGRSRGGERNKQRRTRNKKKCREARTEKGVARLAQASDEGGFPVL